HHHVTLIHERAMASYHSVPFAVFFIMIPPPPRSTPFPYTTLFRSGPASTGTTTSRSSRRRASSRRRRRPSRCRARCRVRHRLGRSEEHTSELQSRSDLVCRLLLEKKKKIIYTVGQSMSLPPDTPGV